MSSWGLVLVSVADVRKDPDQRSEQITQAILGTAVSIVRIEGLWACVRMPDEYQGWIHQGLLHLGDEDLVQRWSQGPSVMVTCPVGVLYSEPSCRSIPLSDIVIGTKLRLLEEGPQWSQVSLPDGRKGWISRADTSDENDLVHLSGGGPEDILRTARAFTGRPYLWGGLTPKGFDCSGFVQTVFGLNGIRLPRDSYQQFACGQEIAERNDLEPADLLFFQGQGAGRITHVAVHMADEEFIHCSSFVRTNSLRQTAGNYEASLEAQFVGIKRIVGGAQGHAESTCPGAQ
jgi:SH3-like domain-containing protein